MESAVEQLMFNEPLFHPIAAIRAMRDSRYRYESNAIAELVDNSIDAEADSVELLLFEQQQLVDKRRVWRVAKLAVVDNGHGMDPKTLVRALSFGGRSEDDGYQHIGKYGVGLPTASVSQCQRVDVWSWQETISNPSHCYLDIDEVERDGSLELPEPDEIPLPDEIVQHCSDQGLSPAQGTVVVWSEIDRITARAETIFQRVERDIGRIHRHFLVDGRLKVRLAAIRNSEVRTEQAVRPDDPLFLMRGTSTPHPLDDPDFVLGDAGSSAPEQGDPMFAEYQPPKFFSVEMDGKQEIVEVRYSMVKPWALGQGKTLPGNLAHGRAAMRDAGVSIVRADRELLMEQSFVGAGARREEPQNRWWGCEVRFDAACDDLFGVDHNKQMAATFTEVAREVAGSDRRSTELRDEIGVDHQLFEIVDHIRATVRNMRADIDEMFKRRRADLKRSAPDAPEKEAERRASKAVDEVVQQVGPQTETDRSHSAMSPEERQGELGPFFREKGVANPEQAAREIVREDARFRIVPDDLSGYQMFSVKSRGGVLIVLLNINHRLYQYLQILEGLEGNQVAHQDAVAILTLVLAWARMEDEITREDERKETEHTAMQWGRQAEEFLTEFLEEIDGRQE